MRFILETISKKSIGQIGVISGVSVTSHGTLSRCAFSGSKLPFYVLFKAKDGGGLEGFETSGAPVSIDEIEARCPGIVYRFSEGT